MRDYLVVIPGRGKLLEVNDIFPYLIQAQGFETIIQHELNRRAGIALFAVFHIVNHDSQAGPLVIRVEIVQVDQSDGLLGIDTCNHQPQLLAGINVYMGIFNVFFQCEMREWGQGVTDIPNRFPTCRGTPNLRVRVPGSECFHLAS